MPINNILKSTSLVDATINSVTSEKARHPLSNVLLRRRSNMKYHSTSTAQQDLDFLLSSTCNAVYMGETNFNTVLLMESADDITYYESGPNLLRQSHRIDLSSWVDQGFPTITASFSAGPAPSAPLAHRIQANAGVGRHQLVTNNITGISYIGGAYVKSLQGATNVQLKLTLGSATTRNYTITNQWTLITHTAVGASGSIADFEILSNQASGDFLVAGAYLKKGAAPYTVFTTNANGLVIGQDTWTDKYKHGFDTTGFIGPYLRVRIPSQTPVDGSSVFKCGRVIPYNYQEFADFPQQPPSFDPQTAKQTQEFNDGSTSTIQLGDTRMRLSFQGQYVSSHILSTLKDFATDPPGTLYVIHDNF